jgi:hypothetical protein
MLGKLKGARPCAPAMSFRTRSDLVEEAGSPRTFDGGSGR